jgi:sigma-E factor negative regulatory protein RseA
MNENKFETLSSIVDSQNISDDCFDDLVKDQQCAQTWHRYHLIGDAIRDDLPEQLNPELSLNIAKAIADEPTVLAPLAKISLPKLIKTKVVKFARPLGQVAIAASAAGLLILNVQQNVADNDAFEPNSIVQTNPLGGVAQPVSFNYQQNSRVSQQQAFVEQQRRFQALLQDHRQQIKLTSKVPPTSTPISTPITTPTSTEVEDTPK